MKLVSDINIVPMHFQPKSDGNWGMIALISNRIQMQAVMKNLTINPLLFDPMTQDIAWLRIDEDTPNVREALLSRQILYSEPGQVLIALASEEESEAINVHGAHGHLELLLPDPNLVILPTPDRLNRRSFNLNSLPNDIFEPVENREANSMYVNLLQFNCNDVTASYENDLNYYTGISTVDHRDPIISRHISHPDNKRTEAKLLKDLRDIGYCAQRHNFTHAGVTYSNIIADLPGTGYFRIAPELLGKQRTFLRDNPDPYAFLPYPYLEEVVEAAKRLIDHWGYHQETLIRELHIRIEEIFRLSCSLPWWQNKYLIPGLGANLIIVGCHLDSTAANDPGFDPTTDPAPGRDDDASGLAAVLSLARYLWRFRGKLTHTIRFCFFNAEEIGLIGSKAYASKLKSLNAPVQAVICMDMIGYNSDSNRIFEIHAGYTDPAIRDLNISLIPYISNATTVLGQLALPQIYQGTGWSGSPDRNVYDGAINRSDHASFHQQGFPAILVSEDFFANLPTEPGADPNPNYHRVSDNIIDLSYAKDITCVVAHAILQLAR